MIVKGSEIVRKNRLTIVFLLLMAIATLSGCNNQGSHDENWSMVQEKTVVFSDGEYLNLWRSDRRNEDVYKLSDETTLLSVKDTIVLVSSFSGLAESFDHLKETAPNAISIFYENEGLHYDLPLELEKAYAGYLDCKNSKKKFNDYFISQEIAPISSNDTIMCIYTSVMLPIGQQLVTEIQTGAIFNKETGEAISTWDIFSVPEEEAKEQLLTLAELNDTALQAEMMEALKAEYILLRSDELQIYFPMGSLPSEEHIHIIAVPYKQLQGIMHSWAIPDEIEQ